MAACRARKPISKVTVDDIESYWDSIDPHFVLESHLPNLTPLEYVDRILIPSNTFAQLPAESRQTLTELFGKPVDISHVQQRAASGG
jgi:hypothetical protein